MVRLTRACGGSVDVFPVARVSAPIVPCVPLWGVKRRREAGGAG